MIARQRHGVKNNTTQVNNVQHSRSEFMLIKPFTVWTAVIFAGFSTAYAGSSEERHEVHDAEPRHEVHDAEPRHEVHDAEPRHKVHDAEPRHKVHDAERRHEVHDAEPRHTD